MEKLANKIARYFKHWFYVHSRTVYEWELKQYDQKRKECYVGTGVAEAVENQESGKNSEPLENFDLLAQF